MFFAIITEYGSERSPQDSMPFTTPQPTSGLPNKKTPGATVQCTEATEAQPLSPPTCANWNSPSPLSRPKLSREEGANEARAGAQRVSRQAHYPEKSDLCPPLIKQTQAATTAIAASQLHSSKLHRRQMKSSQIRHRMNGPIRNPTTGATRKRARGPAIGQAVCRSSKRGFRIVTRSLRQQR